ncbi:uncharacterized protein TNCV_2339841 [Trichonephila clavipes]|nr:uncharacterized protein TNCV_2339841 [Trichonephila clavipes]
MEIKTFNPESLKKCLHGGTQNPNESNHISSHFTQLQLPVWWDMEQQSLLFPRHEVAAVAEWYRYRTVACLVTSTSPEPQKTHRVGQRCTLNLSRAETSSHWYGVRRGGVSSSVLHVT